MNSPAKTGKFARRACRRKPTISTASSDEFSEQNRRIRRSTSTNSPIKTDDVADAFNEFAGTLRRVRRSKPVYSPNEAACRDGERWIPRRISIKSPANSDEFVAKTDELARCVSRRMQMKSPTNIDEFSGKLRRIFRPKPANSSDRLTDHK